MRPPPNHTSTFTNHMSSSFPGLDTDSRLLQQRERRTSRSRRPPPPPSLRSPTPPLAPSIRGASPRPAPRQKPCPPSTRGWPPPQVTPLDHRDVLTRQMSHDSLLPLHQHSSLLSINVSTRRCSVLHMVPYLHSDNSRWRHPRGQPSAPLYAEQHPSSPAGLRPQDASVHTQGGAWVPMIPSFILRSTVSFFLSE